MNEVNDPADPAGTYGIWEIFDSVAPACGDRPAVRWRGQTWTYAELYANCVGLANLLAAHGLGWHRPRAELAPWEAGQDLVATYLVNSPEYLEVTLGGYAARTAPFNVNYRYVADELAYLLNDSGAGAIVYHGRFAETLAEVLPSLDRQPLLLQVADESGADLLPGALDYHEAVRAHHGSLRVEGHSPDDLYVVYTGGTTGMPKSTLWRQWDIWVAALGGDLFEGKTLDELAESAGKANGPNYLPNAPFMHAAAHWTGVRTLLMGGTVVINSVVDRLDPVDVWTLVQDEGVNITLMVGEAFARPLLDELEAGDYDTSSLWLVAVGGAVTSAETKQRMLDAMPHLLIVDGAGSSETGSALSANTNKRGAGDPGVFAPGPGVVVLSEELDAVLDADDDTVGWFAKRGAIPLGYLGDEAKTLATFPVVGDVRYSVPGDRARMRPDGMIELLGRDSVTINSGGEKIFAEEVEGALLRHPALADAVVVGRASERWGQEVVAVVSLRAGRTVTDDELLATTAEHVARYKLPKSIVRVPEVVRSPAGKADYAWARRIVGDGDDRSGAA